MVPLYNLNKKFNIAREYTKLRFASYNMRQYYYSCLLNFIMYI